MTAREYLSRIKFLDTVISHKREELNALRINSGHKQGLTEANSLEGKIKAELFSHYEDKRSIVNQINSLDNFKYSEILYRRYVEFKSLGDIAVEMNYTYQYVVELHGKAIKEFSKRFGAVFLNEDNKRSG